MVSAEYRTGLSLSLIVYFGILLGSAIWAYKRMERMTCGKDGMDHLSSHYLGGRTFGPLLMSGMLVFKGCCINQKSHTLKYLSYCFVSLFSLSSLSILRCGYRNVVCNRLFRLCRGRCSVSDICHSLSVFRNSPSTTHTFPISISNEAFGSGYYSFRWMAATSYFIAGMIGTGIRLRKAVSVFARFLNSRSMHDNSHFIFPLEHGTKSSKSSGFYH